MTSELLHPGEVVLVTFPFSDLSTSRLRPALVLAVSGHEDLVVAFITTTLERTNDATDVLLLEDAPEFGTTGLPIAHRVSGWTSWRRFTWICSSAFLGSCHPTSEQPSGEPSKTS